MTFGAAYIRVSTENQDEYSPEAQKRLILDYAKKNNIVISKEHIFADIGISGTKADKREAFQEMIALAKVRSIQLIQFLFGNLVDLHVIRRKASFTNHF